MNEKELCLSWERFIHPDEKGLRLRDLFLEDVDGARMTDDGGMEITIDDKCYILMRYNCINEDASVCGVFRSKGDALIAMGKVIDTIVGNYEGYKPTNIIVSDVTNEYDGIHICTRSISISFGKTALFQDSIWVDEKIFGKIEV